MPEKIICVIVQKFCAVCEKKTWHVITNSGKYACLPCRVLYDGDNLEHFRPLDK